MSDECTDDDSVAHDEPQSQVRSLAKVMVRVLTYIGIVVGVIVGVAVLGFGLLLGTCFFMRGGR